jgi:hypothetical protein
MAKPTLKPIGKARPKATIKPAVKTIPRYMRKFYNSLSNLMVVYNMKIP